MQSLCILPIQKLLQLSWHRATDLMVSLTHIGVTNVRINCCSHYSRCWLADQFDIVVHIDSTMAVRPLEEPDWDNMEEHEGDLSETYPYGY